MKWMIVLITAVFLGFIPLSQSAWATDDSMAAVLKSYVEIQEALAADTTEGVQTRAKEILVTAKSIKDKKSSRTISGAATKLAGAKNIAAARAAFKNLSKPVVDWAKKTKPAGFEIVDCSMAGAKWVQKAGTIQNPYYGKEMLECGEKVS